MCTGCTTGDIRLTGLNNPLQGRVDVCLDGVWGSVCNDHWGMADAAVVCRQLGYSSSGTMDILTYSNCMSMAIITHGAIAI